MVISAGKEDILLDYSECLEQQIWPADKTARLLSQMIQFGYIGTLNKAYKIFMPVSVVNIYVITTAIRTSFSVISSNMLQDSILNLFFEFLTQAITYGEFKESQQHLLEFKSQCSSLKCNVRRHDYEETILTYYVI